MKKTRKQTALAKCVLATIMAMGMMGYTTVWAEDTVTPTPSPIDKTVAKDNNGAGHIYDASHNYVKGYFWTDLGHAQVKIGSGDEKIDLFTPFIYHTNNDQWKKGGDDWSPVHEGDNSEMECQESMSRITVGEFDRIIKSLYTNDITMAKTIYGAAGQVGLKDKVIKEVEVEENPGQDATVNTYRLVREDGTKVEVGIVDTDTKITGNELTFANGTLTSEITDNAGGTFASSVNGIASQEWVQEKIAEIPSIIDTNSITTVQNDGNGYVTVTGGQGDDGNYHYTVGINEDKLVETIQANDTNTITTAKSGHAIITVNDSVGGDDLDDKNYVIGIDENALKGFIQDNTQDTNTVTTVAVNTNILTIEDNGEGSNHAYQLGINSEQLSDFVKKHDTNTITTVQDDRNGFVVVEEASDPNHSGNHAYTVKFNEQKLNEAIEAQDRYVNGGSIGADGSITLNVNNGEDVTLEGQLKDARLTDIERDKEAGTATLVVKDRYNPEEVNRLTIDDIASKEQNDRDHAEFREHFNELDHRVDNLGSRVDKVGAGAAALAALHPMDFDPDDKLTFAAGYGNYKGRNAAAVGAFYRPDEKVMLSVGGTFGNGENMVNAGISFSLDRTARVSNSRTAMAKEIVDLRANVANLTALVGQLTAGMGGTIEMDRMKLFPDVPENHWAYEYIGRLAAAGIVEGYPDGMFNGNRMMSRYEFAAMLYRALEKGVKLDHKLVREFEPEMGRIHVARISGADGDRGKIERVRVYGGDNRDHYGSKLN
ncbi:YadA-like family protein [Phascolarctobacterium succinatutens]|uniref:YadA-like family protein n=1 Tax=Phascolarctobacterium succinatutens TaxID=626940 RepID=UPI0023F75B35|nr:YadA-like family protein [Phascolarctobacterium succinatutens]